MYRSQSFTVATRGRGTYELTGQVATILRASGVSQALCTVFVHHTSASLILCENADPTVRTDLENFLGRLAPDGDPRYVHDAEGPDDMPAHLRSILTQTSISIPVQDGELDLGTWQGLYLYEHRTAPHRRRITVALID